MSYFNIPTLNKVINKINKQEIVSDAAFNAWPLSSDFNPMKATCKHYYPLIVKPTITNCCKELHLKCGRVPRYLFENVAMHEN